MIVASNLQRERYVSVQSENLFKPWDYVVFTLLIGVSLAAILFFFWHWFALVDWWDYPVIYFTVTFILLIIFFNNFGRWFALPLMKQPQKMIPRPDLRVAVVTTFVSEHEPLKMLEETVKALVALSYPHDTWVLDEADDEEVKEMCHRLGARHFSRKTLPQYQTQSGRFKMYSKHGNYNAWLYEVGFYDYDIITAFDPDHIPNDDFLMHVLGYFNDPEIGYVQAAQVYYNQDSSLVARGAAEETYAYYSSIQMAAYSMGYPLIVGSHNTHRVSALKQVGGFAAHDADDLLLTMHYRAQGWRGVYVPDILARGLAPVDWGGYVAQQRRWARSVLDLKFKYFPKISKDLPLRSRIAGFLHGLNYLHKSFIILTGLILLLFMLVTGMSPAGFSFAMLGRLAVPFAVLQLCEFYRQRFYLDPDKEWGLHWRVALMQYAKWPFFIFALYDVLSGRQFKYTLTRKTKSNAKSHLLLLSNLIIVTLVFVAWSVGMFVHGVANPLLTSFAVLMVVGSLYLMMS